MMFFATCNSVPLTVYIAFWILIAASVLVGAASVPFSEPQKSLASWKLSIGLLTNQNSAPSTKMDESSCPSEKQHKQL